MISQSITAAWKDAMKNRDPKKDVLSLIRTELKNKWIEERRELNAEATTDYGLPDPMSLAVLDKMAKQRRDSITEYQKGGRDDLVQKEKFELSVIESFLPTMMTRDEVDVVVATQCAALEVKSSADMGRAMKGLTVLLKGKANGKDIQESVRAYIQKQAQV